jgi:hypothetical protein
MKFPRLTDPRVRQIALPAAAIAIGTAGSALGASAGSSDDGSPSNTVVAEVPNTAELKSERDAWLADVAGRLNVDQADLEDAMTSASIDRLVAANKDGRLSDDQLAEMEKHIRQGDLPPGPVPFGGGPILTPPPGGGPISAASDYLGVDEDELFDRVSKGDSLADIAQYEGKSVDGLKQAILNDERRRLDKAVDDGDLTQSQADDALDGLESHLDDMINGGFFGPKRIEAPGKAPRGGLTFPAPPPAGALPSFGGER